MDGGAIYLRSSFGSRDRVFWKAGLEPRFRGKAWIGGRRHEYEVGARLHTEYYKNERNNRPTFAGPVTTRDRDISTTNAVAAWVHDKVQVTRRLSVSGGLRVEHYASKRRFERQGDMDVDFDGTTSTTELIPGLGFTVDLGRTHTVFGGVHRGFAPARTSDSIDSMGTDLDLDPEESWNYELGARGNPVPWFRYEVAAFFMDFQNQVVPANESGGASTTNTNAGETEHYGLEVSAGLDLLATFLRRHRHPRASKLWLDASWMFLRTENTTHGGVFEGNDLPYAPENTGSFGLRWEHPRHGASLGLYAAYTGEQFADQANTRAASADGTVGILEATWVVDAKARLRIPRSNLVATFGVNNLFDETYVASRAPQGIFPGRERHLFVGLEADVR